MKRIISIISFLSIVSFSKAQPFSITAYIDSSVITQNDISSTQSVTYLGQGMKWVFDRRVDDWVYINTYLFNVIYDDGLTSEIQVNPEFGSVASATFEAEKYAFIIGQLPTCLRIEVNKVWIHQGTESFGGGFNAVLIHTGQSASYEALGILEEVLLHEATHTALDLTHSTSSGWLNSQNLDNEFISTYAASSPNVEDLAESFLTWVMVRQCDRRISVADSITISQTIPNRINYLDSQNFEMHPICINTTPLTVIDENDPKIVFNIYPNPTKNEINFSVQTNVQLTNVTGQIIEERKNVKTLDLTDQPTGIYFLTLTDNNGQVVQRSKIVKE